MCAPALANTQRREGGGSKHTVTSGNPGLAVCLLENGKWNDLGLLCFLPPHNLSDSSLETFSLLSPHSLSLTFQPYTHPIPFSIFQL